VSERLDFKAERTAHAYEAKANEMMECAEAGTAEAGWTPIYIAAAQVYATLALGQRVREKNVKSWLGRE